MFTSKPLAALAAGLLALSACGEAGEDEANAEVAIIDQTTSNLLAAEIDSINGTYGAGCLMKNAGNWSLGVAASPTLANGALSVVKNNSTCVLSLTSVRLSDGNTYSASAPITLGAAYATPVSFGTPIKFWANAKLSSTSFASGTFTLTLLYSDDPRFSTGDYTASFAVSSAQSGAQGVTAPNYSLSTAGLTLETDFDDVVQTVSGNLSLTVSGSADATYYVVVNGAVANTYNDIRDAYDAGTAVAFTTSIAGSSFNLSGADLTSSPVRTLILAKVTDGVRSYQKFAITFNPPSRS